ncbi:MAG: hypothetical protein KBS34_04030 [Phascolarctobacterium sp.]|nr:hypothetical protein [Candidatus Phascolarctobacterium equi]
MNRSRGSVLLITLASGLVLLTLSLLCMHYLWRNAQRESEYIRRAQVRNVVYGEMAKMMESDPDGAMTDSQNVGVLHPGGVPLTLTKEVRFIGNNFFRICEVGAKAGDYGFTMNQMTFTPSDKVQERAGNEIFSAYNSFNTTTKKYIPAESSTGSHFNVINTFDLQNDHRNYETQDMQIFRRLGFGSMIYACNGNLTFPKDRFCGDGMFIVNGTLTFSEGAEFTGRTVFLVQGSGSVTISRNVKMADVLILSSGTITVAAGCDLTGHFRSNTSVNISGKGTFTSRVDAGRPFYSFAYVWD